MFGSRRQEAAKKAAKLKKAVLGSGTWKKGHHVMIYGDYKPLSRGFKPSVRTLRVSER